MKAAKFVVGLIAAVAGSLTTAFGPETTVGHVITIVILVAGAIGVYLVPNAPTVTPPAIPPASQYR